MPVWLKRVDLEIVRVVREHFLAAAGGAAANGDERAAGLALVWVKEAKAFAGAVAGGTRPGGREQIKLVSSHEPEPSMLR